MHRPVIVLTFAYTAGILLGHGSLYFPYTVSLLAVLGLVAAAAFVALRRVTFTTTLLFAISALIGSAAYLYSVLWLPSDHYARIISEDKSIHQIKGTIASALDRDPDRTGFVLDIQSMDGTPASGRLRVSIREAVSSIGYGDVIIFSGRLFQPGGFRNPGGFDYPAYLARSGIYRTVSIKNVEQLRVLVPGKGIFRKIQDWRERIRQAFLASTRAGFGDPSGHGAGRRGRSDGRNARPVPGGRRHAYHLHLRLPSRHGCCCLFRPDRVF